MAVPGPGRVWVWKMMVLVRTGGGLARVLLQRSDEGQPTPDPENHRWFRGRWTTSGRSAVQLGQTEATHVGQMNNNTPLAS